MKYSNCQENILDSSKFSPHCGNKVDAKSFCSQCGTSASGVQVVSDSYADENPYMFITRNAFNENICYPNDVRLVRFVDVRSEYPLQQALMKKEISFYHLILKTQEAIYLFCSNLQQLTTL
jgi:hypothetical protein